MPTNSNLGVRIKENYESVSKTRLMRREPVAIRLDGKAFHTFTRGFEKPFDEVLGRAMRSTMMELCKSIQGCVFGYTQSDEITLILIDYQKLNSSAWFDYEVQKMCSISASMATMYFNKFFDEECAAEASALSEPTRFSKAHDLARRKGAMFDARCFNIPKEEVANMLYWRQMDATRNSIQMVGQYYFSHKQLQNQSCNDIQNMLFVERNVNWNDYPIYQKRGAACYKTLTLVLTENDKELHDAKISNGLHIRSKWYLDLEMPILKDNWDYINKHIFVGEA